MLALFIFFRNYQATIAAWIPPVLLGVGLISLVLGSIGYGRYRHVYDFEPTTLLGRSTNGKFVRGLLKSITFVGGWLIVIGGYLLFIQVNTT